jgi:hypothetical protein
MITAFLKEQGLVKIPSARTLYRLLAVLPAASTKAMRGVNNTAEAAWRAFDTLLSAISELKNTGLNEETTTQLTGCVNVLKNYFKHYFTYQITWDNPCRDHCAQHALSDLDPHFHGTCTIVHSETCEHCDNLKVVIESLLGATSSLMSTIGQHKHDIIVYDVETAHADIFAYKSHIMRAFAQNSSWQILKDQLQENVVFITSDWAMKW